MRGISKLKMVTRKITFLKGSKLDVRAPTLNQDQTTPTTPGASGRDGLNGADGPSGIESSSCITHITSFTSV